jgi:hypothetical protein
MPPPTIHTARAARRGERLGALDAADAEPDNLHTLKAIIETSAQRAESAIGSPFDNEMPQSSRRSSRPSSFDRICRATHEHAYWQRPLFGVSEGVDQDVAVGQPDLGQQSLDTLAGVSDEGAAGEALGGTRVAGDPDHLGCLIQAAA